MSDVVANVISAMTEAIENQRRVLEADAGVLKSVTLELQLANGGAVIDSTCWAERRGVHRAPVQRKAAS